MRNYKKLKYILLCAGLLTALNGCGKKTEENPDVSAIRGTTSAFEWEEVIEEDGSITTRKVAKSKNKKETSETDSENNAETEATAQDGATETKNPENSENPETSEMIASENHAESSEAEIITDPEHPEIPVENPEASSDSDSQYQNTDSNQETNQETDSSQATDTGSEEPSETIPEVTETPVADPDALTVSYQGHVIIIGGDATVFVNAVKPLEEPLKAPSCYGDGDDVVYTYDGMTLTTLREADREIVRNVDITSPGIAPVEGYDIGTTADFKGEKRITSPNGSMIIITEIGGIVEYISYNIS